MSNGFPSWASSASSSPPSSLNNPLLRATPSTNQAIYQQRRGMTPTGNSGITNYRQNNTSASDFDRSTVSFSSNPQHQTSNNNSNFIPRNYRETYRDPYLQTTIVKSPTSASSSSSPSSPSSPNTSNEDRLRNYMQRPANELSPSRAQQQQFSSSPASQQRQSSSFSGVVSTPPRSSPPSSSLYTNSNSNGNNYDRIYNFARSRMENEEPSYARPSFSSRSDLANERLSSAEKLIAEVMARHGHLDDNNNDIGNLGERRQQTAKSSFSQSSIPTPSASTPSLCSVSQLQRSGFAPSTIQRIVRLNNSLEHGKDILKESDEKTDRIRTDFNHQVLEVQDQVAKMKQKMEEWKRQIKEMSPMRIRGSQFSYEPEDDGERKGEDLV